jgi:extradiol dioxygenase family protein
MSRGLLVIIVLGCVVVAGCGTTATRTGVVVSVPTKARYIARADAVCQADNRTYKAIMMRLFGFQSSAKLAREEQFAASRRAEAQLAAIPVPAGSKGLVSEWLHWRSVATTDSANASDYPAVLKANARAADLARTYGLIACARWQSEGREPISG